MMMLVMVFSSVFVLSSCSGDDENDPSKNKKDISVTASSEVATYHSVILKGYTNGANGDVGFCYSTTNSNPTPENSTCVKTSSILADNSYTISIDNLEVNVTYYYRAFATKDNVIVMAVDVKTFKTSEPKREAVDLDLPSGIKWANMNIGATIPEGYGDHFAWGETKPKSTYTWSNYKWCNGTGNTLTKYCISSDFGTVDNKTTLDPEDDAAHVNWGGSWRMPTHNEFAELLKNCTWTWTTLYGIEGYKVASKTNNNSIFLPAAGYRGESSLEPIEEGVYWSSSLGSDETYDATHLYAHRIKYYVWEERRRFGNSIRAVCP